MRSPRRPLRALRHLPSDWLYCLLQGLLSLANIAFWLVGVVVSPLLVLVLGPRLATVLATCVSWLAGLDARLVSWRQRRRLASTAHDALLGDRPWRSYSVWQSLRCLGINALSLPVHVAAVIVFPLVIAWAPLHSRLLSQTLCEPSAGPGPEPGSRGGHGLVGMRERVRALGGTLEAGPDDDGGFRVLAVLPLDPAPDAAGLVEVDTETAPTDRSAPSPEGLDQEDDR